MKYPDEKAGFMAHYGSADHITSVLHDGDTSDFVKCTALNNPNANLSHVELVLNNPGKFGLHVANSAIDHPLTTVNHLDRVVKDHRQFGNFRGQNYIRAIHRLQSMGYNPDET